MPGRGTVEDGGGEWRAEARRLLTELAGVPARPYSNYDFGRGRDERCLSVVLPEERARALPGDLRGRLPGGAVAFIGTTRWLGDERPGGMEVVVGSGESQFDIPRLARTNGVNYGLDTEAIVAKLREYDALCGITITHAETDTIEFTIRRNPPDLAAFAADVYAFCPDTVDQGVGRVEELADSIDVAGEVFLWWD